MLSETTIDEIHRLEYPVAVVAAGADPGDAPLYRGFLAMLDHLDAEDGVYTLVDCAGVELTIEIEGGV